MDEQLSERIAEVLNRRCLYRNKSDYTPWDSWHITTTANCYQDIICQNSHEIIYICDRIRESKNDCSILKVITLLADSLTESAVPVLELAFFIQRLKVNP